MAERVRIIPVSSRRAPSTQTRLPERGPKPDTETDLRIAPPDAAAHDASQPLTLEHILGQVRDLPALPTVVLQVVRQTAQADSPAHAIADTISRDPSFTARILKLANSSYYGLPRAVGTVREAITLLGFRTVRNMAIVAATRDTLHLAVAGYELCEGDLWRHSLACGMAAQMLSVAAHLPDCEEAFIAGLLHDIGKVVLGVHVRSRIPAIEQVMEETECAFYEAERLVLGFDHAEVGGRVAKSWNLPTALVQAIAWHHDPKQNNAICTLAALVHVADVICLIAGVGLGVNGLRARLCPEALTALHLTETDVENVLNQLVTQIAKSQPFFEI